MLAQMGFYSKKTILKVCAFEMKLKMQFLNKVFMDLILSEQVEK